MNPRDRWRRVTGDVLVGAGVFVGGVGLIWVGMYVYGVIDVLGEPDQSWLFWGLAILFGGIALTRVGSRLIAWGRAMLS